MRTVHSRADSPGGYCVAFYCGSGNIPVSTSSVNFNYCSSRLMGMGGRKVLHVARHRAWMDYGGVFDGIRLTFLVCSGQVVSGTVPHS